MDSEKSVVTDVGKFAVKKLEKFLKSKMQSPNSQASQLQAVPPDAAAAAFAQGFGQYPHPQQPPQHPEYHFPQPQQPPTCPYYHPGPAFQNGSGPAVAYQYPPQPYYGAPQYPYGGPAGPVNGPTSTAPSAYLQPQYSQQNGSFPPGTSMPPSSSAQSLPPPSDSASVSSVPEQAAQPGYSQVHPLPAPQYPYGAPAGPANGPTPTAPPAYLQPQHAQQNGSFPPGTAMPPSSSAQSLPPPSDSASVSSVPEQAAPPGYPQVHPLPVSAPVAPSADGLHGVPPSSQLADQFNGMHLATNPQPHPVPATAPPASSKPPVFKGWDRIFDQELILQVNTRPHSARATLGSTAVLEAKKGLSRILRPGVESDLELFGQQLKMSDASACEPDFRRMNDKVVCFAISYVQCDCAKGRFKFTEEAWMNFKAACEEIAACGVVEMRVWLDQCLWLRDASQGAWAHTGLMPYVLWPVISLGVKAAGGERTVETYNRMWPFVEELAGLWSMGVIITSEYRGKTAESGIRRWLSFQLRHRCEPEKGMWLLLLNIFHGAVDSLETGWKEDVEELKEMARWNVMCQGSQIIVGSDWKSRIASLPHESTVYRLISKLQMSREHQYLRNSIDTYLDGSRKLHAEGPWHGLLEWVSGNEGFTCAMDWFQKHLEQRTTKINIITTEGEFQFLGHENSFDSSLWLLVAMDGRTSNFSRGHVLWTKVMHGAMTCKLGRAIQDGKQHVLEQILQEQLGARTRVVSMTTTNQPIEWT